MAAVTNEHKLAGWKQQNLILLQLRRPEVQNQHHWIKVKPLKASREDSWLVQVPVATSIPMLRVVSLQAPWPLSENLSLLRLYIFFSMCCQISLCLSFIRMHVIAFRAHENNPEYQNSLISKSLITSTKSFLPHKVRFTRSGDWDPLFNIPHPPFLGCSVMISKCSTQNLHTALHLRWGH